MRFEKASLFTALFAFVLSFVLVVETLESAALDIPARSLDALLQRLAFEALSFRPRTGVVFEAKLPVSLTGNSTGMEASAMRLRSGSLRTRGVRSYREFRIPVGVTEQPYAKRIVLVYHRLGGNFSSRFYPLPGFTYLAPVLGLIAYDASNLSAVDLPELDLRAEGKPITAWFGNVSGHGPGSGVAPKCVFFDLHGSVQFDRPLRGNACEMVQQGHLSIVVESTAPSPAPTAGDDDHDHDHDGDTDGGDKSRAGKIAGCLVGVLVLLAGIVMLGLKVKERRNTRRNIKEEKAKREMEWDDGEKDEALEMTSFGNIRAPFAKVTRTQPVLEDRYVP